MVERNAATAATSVQRTAHNRKCAETSARKASERGALDVLDDAPPKVGLWDLDEELLQQQLQRKDLFTHRAHDLALAAKAEAKGVTKEHGSEE